MTMLGEARAQQPSDVWGQKKPKQHNSLCNELDLLLELEAAPLQQLGTRAGKWEEQSTAAREGGSSGEHGWARSGFHTVVWQRSRALLSVWVSQSGSSLAGLLIGVLGVRPFSGVVFSACFLITR